MKKTFRSATISTIIMLLVAIITLTSVTYAWFVSNAVVTGDGMVVRAKAGSTLAISTSANGTFGQSATANLTKVAMQPATSFDGETFYRLLDGKKAVAGNNSAVELAAGDTLEEKWDSYMDVAIDVPYIAKQTYFIKSLNGTYSNINVDVAMKQIATSEGAVAEDLPNTGIANSLRVAVKIGTADAQVFAPATAGTYETYNAESEGTKMATPTLVKDGNETYTVNVGETTAVPVVVTIWFEGQDPNCNTYNASINLKNFPVSVSFSGVGTPTDVTVDTTAPAT